MDTALEYWLLRLLRERLQTHFYGEVSVSFQNGNISLVKITESLKPPVS